MLLDLTIEHLEGFCSQHGLKHSRGGCCWGWPGHADSGFVWVLELSGFQVSVYPTCAVLVTPEGKALYDYADPAFPDNLERAILERVGT